MKRVKKIEDLEVGKYYLWQQVADNKIRWLVIIEKIDLMNKTASATEIRLFNGTGTDFEIGEEQKADFKIIKQYWFNSKLWKLYYLSDEELSEIKEKLVLAKL